MWCLAILDYYNYIFVCALLHLVWRRLYIVCAPVTSVMENVALCGCQRVRFELFNWFTSWFKWNEYLKMRLFSSSFLFKSCFIICELFHIIACLSLFSITYQTSVSDLVIWCSGPGIAAHEEEVVELQYAREWQPDDVTRLRVGSWAAIIVGVSILFWYFVISAFVGLSFWGS